MKKIFLLAVAVFATCGAFAQNSDDRLDDFEYRVTKLEKRYYTDHYLYSVGDDPKEYSCCTMQKHGIYIGALVGGQYFNKEFSPNVGALVGYETKHLGFEYDATFSRGNYTPEADRTNDYLEFDSKLFLKVKLIGTRKQNFQVWAGVYGQYKMDFDYHENVDRSQTVSESDYERVIINKTDHSFVELKASNLGYGGQLEFVLRPTMSPINYRLTVGAGNNQKFYTDGNRDKFEVYAEFKVTWNFMAQKLWDKNFLKKTGLSKSQVKKMNKNRESGTF